MSHGGVLFGRLSIWKVHLVERTRGGMSGPKT